MAHQTNNALNRIAPELKISKSMLIRKILESFVKYHDESKAIGGERFFQPEPVLENWIKEFKDPINKAGEIIDNTSEVIKKLPDLPIIMDKANDVITLITEGKFNPNTLAYRSLREEKLKLELVRNKLVIGILALVIFAFIVF